MKATPCQPALTRGIGSPFSVRLSFTISAMYWEGARGRRGESDDSTYEIEVCDFAELEYRQLMELTRVRKVSKFRPGDRQSAVETHEHREGASREVEAQIQWKRPDTEAWLREAPQG